MYHRVEIGYKSKVNDIIGEKKRKEIKNFLNIQVNSVRIRKIYTIVAELDKEELERITKELLIDPITEQADAPLPKFHWLIEVGYKPGVTDNVGRTSKTAIQNLLNKTLEGNEGVYTSTQYLLEDPHLGYRDVNRITHELLANELVERWTIQSYEEVKRKGIDVPPPIIHEEENFTIGEYDLNVDDAELVRISRNGVLALNLDEMKTIRDYFKRKDVIDKRQQIGIGPNPTDVEIETLAQTWSEHCKHKIFNAIIRFRDGEEEQIIDRLFKTYITRVTEELKKKFSWLISVFEDNAGVIRFNDKVNIVAKIETHNTPSALEPYGGAITGIVGVNRDPLGTGRGSKLLFNIFAYCFGDPFFKEEIRGKILHPRRIRDGVHRGVIDGGNQSGIPLVRGREFFDQRYMKAKPLVYCGTYGVMPKEIRGSPSHIKRIDTDDLIVMIGGRVGKDGIHGATFSSEELHKGSPVQAVQIGDPITQKIMSDFLIEARDLDLFKSITDNGAGGLASSVGEMARFSNGCEIDLEAIPLKYQGLEPWEILLSESQERMTVGVAPSKIDAFLNLAGRRDVEATVIGRYVNSSTFQVKYGNRIIAYLDLDFLHEGVPQKKLVAIWKKPKYREPKFDPPEEYTAILKEMLARLNVCSIEKKLRQYDHEVKGLSIVKPLVGKEQDVPSDGTISLLELGSTEGLIFAEGLNPHYSDIDTYNMAASVIDEAVRRVIAVGGKLPSERTPFAALDNFCWCDPEYSEQTPDGYYKLAQLVRACQALYDYSKAFNIPFISGKDSMKNDSIIEGVKFSIPPTLMVSVIAKMDDVSKAVTMDVKQPKDLVYLVGETFDELGGSEFYHLLSEQNSDQFLGGKVPRVHLIKAKEIYSRMMKATEKTLVHSIHTPTKGGLAVALAKSAFAGGYGMQVFLQKVPYTGVQRDYSVLFSETNSRFIVTVSEDDKKDFEKVMEGCSYGHIGFVVEEPVLSIRGLYNKEVIHVNLKDLKRSWKSKLEVM